MATRKIGGAIVLEGANKYNSDLKAIKSNLTTLRSEMKLANATNKESMNTTEALSKKGELLGKMYTEVGKKVETYGKMYEDAAKKQQKAAQDIDKYSKELEEAKAALSEMKKEGAATDQELEKQEKVVSDLSNKLQKSEKAYETAGQKMNQYKTAGNNAKTELVNLDNELKKNDKYLQEAKESTDGTAKSIDNLGKETAETKERVSVFGDVLKANLASEVILHGVRMIANGLKNVASAAYDAGSSFDAQMSKVGTISNASASDMAKLEAKAKEMGATTIFSATESAEALKYMAMAGWKTDQMLAGLPGIMNLAAASGEDLATTSDIVTDALTAFGMSAEESGHFADVLAQASSNANTNVSMMGETFKYAAPVAGALSMNVEDVAVGIGLMANAGIKASQAGTSLRRILLEMGKDIKVSSDSMGEMIVKTTNADGTMRTFSDIVVDLRSAFSGLSDAEKKSNAQLLVGKNAVSGFLSIINASQADFDKLTNSIQNADGAAARMAAQMNDNLKGDVTIMNSALEGLAIAFEDCFDDAARTSVQGATEVIGKLKSDIESGDMGVSLKRMGDAFEDLSKRTLEFAEDALPNVIDGLTWLMDNSETVISLISGMITAQLATKTVTPVIMACQAAYVALTTAEEGAAIAQGTLNTVMSANPIGLIVTTLGFAAGALATYTALTGEAGDETYNLIKSNQEFTASLEESAKRRAENSEKMKIEAATASQLKGELEQLQSKTELSVEEQIRQKEIVSELNGMMPELNLAIDEQTGKLDEHSRAVLKDVDALMQEYLAQAAQKDLAEIADELFEAQSRVLAINKERTAALQELKQAQQEFIEQTKEENDEALNTQERIVGLREKVEELDNEYINANKAVKEQKERFAEVNGTVEQVTESSEQVVEAQESIKQAYDETTGTMIDRTEEQVKALEKFQEAVANTVTGVNPLFDELKTSTDTTLKDVAQNLETNAKAAEEYADALEVAISNANYGASTQYTELVNKLAEKGPEATELLKELASGAEEHTKEFSDAFNAMTEVIEGNDSIAAVTSELVDTVGTHMTTLTDTVSTKNQEVTETLQTEGEAQTEAVQTTAQDITKATEKGIEDTVKAVTENAPQVTKEVQTVANDSLKAVEDTSGKYRAAGSKLMKELAAGIKSESSAVRSAMQQALQTAVDNLDISGLSARIDRVLGSKLKG